MIARILIGATQLVIASGCATSVTTADESTKGTTTSYDQYLHAYTVTGLQLDLGDFPNITKYQLRGGFDEHGDREFFQLYLDHWDQFGWRFLDSTFDTDGHALSTTILSRTVKADAAVDEIVAIDLSRQYVVDHLEKGINVKLFGQSGSVVIVLQPIYVQGFLRAFDDEKAVAASGKTLMPRPSSKPADVQPAIASPKVEMPGLEELTASMSEGVSFKTNRPESDVARIVNAVLSANGYAVANVSANGTIVTQPHEMRLSTDLADCGKSWGIPYLLDDRAHTVVLVSVAIANEGVQVRTGIGGVYKPGHGAADQSLACHSRGVIEQQLVEKIRTQL